MKSSHQLSAFSLRARKATYLFSSLLISYRILPVTTTHWLGSGAHVAERRLIWYLSQALILFHAQGSRSASDPWWGGVTARGAALTALWQLAQWL